MTSLSEKRYFGLLQPLLAEFCALIIHSYWGSMIATPAKTVDIFNVTSSADVGGEYLLTSLLPALQAGFAVYMIIVLFWKICIINFNPAISVGFVICGVLHPTRLIPYIIAQCLGSTLGAYFAYVIKGDAPGPITVAEGANIAAVIFHEAIVTGAMVLFAIVTVVQKDYDQSTGPIAIGFTVFQGILGGKWIGGCCMNASRAFGPALVLNDWTRQWVWWVGDFLGAILFSVIYMLFFAPCDKIWIKRLLKKDSTSTSSSGTQVQL